MAGSFSFEDLYNVPTDDSGPAIDTRQNAAANMSSGGTAPAFSLLGLILLVVALYAAEEYWWRD